MGGGARRAGRFHRSKQGGADGRCGLEAGWSAETVAERRGYATLLQGGLQFAYNILRRSKVSRSLAGAATQGDLRLIANGSYGALSPTSHIRPRGR